VTGVKPLVEGDWRRSSPEPEAPRDHMFCHLGCAARSRPARCSSPAGAAGAPRDPPGTPGARGVLPRCGVLRWFPQAATVQPVTTGSGFPPATATCMKPSPCWRAKAPELPDVLRERLAAGDTHVILDGTVIRSDRVAMTTENEKGKTINLWYSGKHKAFGGNVQFGVDRRRMSFVALRCVPRQQP
jgi:hypothetical protein